MSTNIYIPYTYLIGWSKLNWWYYGVEFSNSDTYKIANPSNLWTQYFTSSKQISIIRDIYGEPDIIEIRHTFKDSLSARNWESKTLKRMKVVGDPKWLNQFDGKCYENPDLSGKNDPMYGKTHTKHSKKLQSRKKQNIYNGVGNPFYGKTHTIESNEKNRQAKIHKMISISVTSPDNIRWNVTGIRKFAKEYNLNPHYINNVLKGIWKKYNGWFFEYI